MGKLVITAEEGAGLYRGKLVHDTAALLAEKAGLEALNIAYWRQLNQALDHQKLLRRDQAMYRETLDALVQQWKDILEQKTQWPPPEIAPEDAEEDGTNPVTGLPYTDSERQEALASEAVEKINTARTAGGLSPLTRSLTLDRQSTSQIVVRSAPVAPFADFVGRDGYLEMLMRQKSIQDHGRTIQDALLEEAPGVVFDALEGMMAVGPSSSADAIAALKRDPDSWNRLMDPDVNEIGARYQYNPAQPGSHIWNVTAVKARPAPAGNAAFFADPAGAALVDAIEDALGPLQAGGLYEGPDGGSGGGGTGAGSWNAGWQANTQYGAGTTVQGRRASGSSCLCLSRNSGLSGATEPLWPGAGGGAGDNQIVWTVLSDIPDPTAALVNAWYGYPY